MLQKLIGFFKDEDGATAVEYALMVALIAAVIIIAVQAIGTESKDKFQQVADEIAAAGEEGTGD